MLSVIHSPAYALRKEQPIASNVNTLLIGLYLGF